MDTQFLTPRLWAIPSAFPIWIAETSLMALALTVVALLTSRSGRISPAARHALWLAVLVRLMIPPTIHWPWAGTLGPATSPATVAAVERDEAKTEDLSEVAAIEFATSLPLNPIEPSEFVAELEPPSEILTTSISVPNADEPSVIDEEPAATPPPSIPEPSLWSMLPLGQALICIWILGSIVVGTVQLTRILAFRRRLGNGQTDRAPDWLVEETRRIAGMLRVKPPTASIVPGISSPMLWCLGRPRLLIPRNLIDEFDATRWRSVLAHELAHLRRGDHWVSRLELLAEIVWWWNPVYRHARHRLDAEAELACDAMVVSLLPDDRLTYADSLLQLCSKLSIRSSTTHIVPALGVAGSGSFFEKRLTMILKETDTFRTSAWSPMAAALLVLLTVPAWTLATPPDTASVKPNDDDVAKVVEFKAATEIPVASAIPVAPVPPIPPIPPAAPAAITITGQGGQALVLGNQPSAKTIQLKDKAKLFKNVKNDEQDEKEEAEFEAKMEEFAEKMEAFAESVVEKALGPDFEKRMEDIGKKLEKKYGPGSEFAKAMEAAGKEIEKKYGPGSEFEKLMKQMGKDIEKQFGPGSEFEKAMKKQAEDFKADAAKAAQNAKAAAAVALKNKKNAEELAKVAKREAGDEKHLAERSDASKEDEKKAAEEA